MSLPRAIDTDGLELAAPDRAELLVGQLSDHAEELHSLRARAKLRVSGRVGEEILTQIVVFERPDKLRLEFFATNLNKLTSILITRNGFLHAIDPLQMKVYRGLADQQTIRRLVSVPFSPEEMMLWLTGRYAPPTDQELLSYAAFIDGQRYLLRFKLQDGRSFTAIVSEDDTDQRLRLLSLEVQNVEGRRVLISKYNYSEDAPEPELPSTIDFWVAEEGLTGNLEILQSVVNPDLRRDRDALFTGRTPPEADLIQLDEGMQEIEPLM